MKLQIRHQISIAIGAGAARAVQHVLLTPRTYHGQAVRNWQIAGPGVIRAAKFVDAFGNEALIVNQAKPDAELILNAAGEVETFDRSGVVGALSDEPVPVLFTRHTELTPPVPELTDGLDGKARGRIGLFHALMAEITPSSGGEMAQSQSSDGQSQSQSQGGSLPADDDALTHRFIGAVRGLGIPARYVTGYLAPEDGDPPRFHGWAEAYDEGLGWIGFDCALQLCPTERHVRVAIGLDAASCCPVRGVPSSAAPRPLAVDISITQ